MSRMQFCKPVSSQKCVRGCPGSLDFVVSFDVFLDIQCIDSVVLVGFWLVRGFDFVMRFETRTLIL